MATGGGATEMFWRFNSSKKRIGQSQESRDQAHPRRSTAKPGGSPGPRGRPAAAAEAALGPAQGFGDRPRTITTPPASSHVSPWWKKTDRWKAAVRKGHSRKYADLALTMLGEAVKLKPTDLKRLPNEEEVFRSIHDGPQLRKLLATTRFMTRLFGGGGSRRPGQESRTTRTQLTTATAFPLYSLNGRLSLDFRRAEFR